MKCFIAVVLTLMLCLTMVGCGGSQGSADTQITFDTDFFSGATHIEADPAHEVITDDARIALADFALELLRQNEGQTQDNILVSPLSALGAMTMAANGAQGETLRQIETSTGMPLSMLNAWFSQIMGDMLARNAGAMEMANSIWVNDTGRFTVNPQFLSFNAEKFGAKIQTIPFNNQAVTAINDWVKEETKGMIPEILEEIPKDAVMYLFNALAFRRQWEEQYQTAQVRRDTFTLENGQTRQTELMYYREDQYILTEDATGFIKPYAGGRYAFVALLPREDLSVEQYLAGLDGNSLVALLDNAQKTEVNTALPKFEMEYNADQSQSLMNMGITHAFDKNKADFSLMGEAKGVLYISRVLQRTYIQVNEEGTEAAAATAFEMKLECALDEETKIPEVILNRPFVYLILDTKTNFPVFMGTMMDVAG